MKNREAIRILRKFRNDSEIAPKGSRFYPALDLAILALRRFDAALVRARKAGHKGGTTTTKRYGKKKRLAWARRGGRPPKLCECGHMVRQHIGPGRCRECVQCEAFRAKKP
jgi:hypothetical protein